MTTIEMIAKVEESLAAFDKRRRRDVDMRLQCARALADLTKFGLIDTGELPTRVRRLVENLTLLTLKKGDPQELRIAKVTSTFVTAYLVAQIYEDESHGAPSGDEDEAPSPESRSDPASPESPA